jgi:hypothetical protein
VQQQQAVPRGRFAHLLPGVEGARHVLYYDVHSYFDHSNEQHLALQVSLRRPRLAALFLRQDLIELLILVVAYLNKIGWIHRVSGGGG